MIQFIIMKKICLIIVAVVATLFMCSAASTFMSDSKVTVTYNSMSYTTSLSSAEMVYKSLPEDLKLQIREGFDQINVDNWILGKVVKGNYQGIKYCYDGNQDTPTMKYNEVTIKATNISKVDIARIFDLYSD